MRKVAGFIMAAAVVAGPALAKAPEPRKPLDLDRFMGRWYEILRTPNALQSNCYAAYQVWRRTDDPDKFMIDQSCHRDSVTGEVRTTPTAAKLIDPQTKAKFTASMLSGIIKKDYWVLDRGDNYEWMIASSASGTYASLLSRKPTMPAAEIAAHKAEMAAMGLNTDKLVAMGAK